MKNVRYAQAIYLSKIIISLLIIVSACATAFYLPKSNFSEEIILVGIGILSLLFIMFFPMIYFIYKKMDELQKRLHEHASVLTITLSVTISGVLGVLQANQIIPLFSQFWILALTIVIWGTALSFVDKYYK